MSTEKHNLTPFLLLCLIGFAASGLVALAALGLFLAMIRIRPIDQIISSAYPADKGHS